MSQATVPTTRLQRASSRMREAHVPNAYSVARNGAGVDRTAIDQDIDNLAVRIAVPDDDRPIAELASRAGAARPSGGLLVGSVGERVLAVASIVSRETLSDPTPSGFAAAAVLRYRIADGVRRRTPRRAGSPS